MHILNEVSRFFKINFNPFLDIRVNLTYKNNTFVETDYLL